MVIIFQARFKYIRNLLNEGSHRHPRGRLLRWSGPCDSSSGASSSDDWNLRYKLQRACHQSRYSRAVCRRRTGGNCSCTCSNCNGTVSLFRPTGRVFRADHRWKTLNACRHQTKRNIGLTNQE